MFLRPDSVRRLERRNRAIWVIACIILAFLVLRGAAVLWTNYLWFRSVGFGGVFSKGMWVTVLLAVSGFLIVLGVIWGNLVLTTKVTPTFQRMSTTFEEEMIERYREWILPRLRVFRWVVAVLLAAGLGLAGGAWRDGFFLFTNSVPFGVTDPHFGTDISFYVFRLPFWIDLTAWLTNVVVFTLMVVGSSYFLTGAVRMIPGQKPQIGKGVKLHLSVLAAILAVIRASSYWLGRYELLSQPNPNKFFGVGFTADTARIPALELLTLVAIVAAVLFIWNVRRPGWTLAMTAIGGWLFVSLAAGTLFPFLVQKFQVDPNPLVRESKYLSRAIEATRTAYGIDEVEIRPFEPDLSLTAEIVAENSLTLENLRMWDPDVLVRSFQNRQEIRSYYALPKLDSDRYLTGGTLSQVMVSAREIEDGSVDIPTDWQNQKLIYTHGFGLVVANAAQVGEDGQPQLLLSDVPPVATEPLLEMTEPRIYFGETYTDKSLIVITGDRPQEIDFPLAQGTAEYSYQGSAGVGIGSFFHRLAFALREQDMNLIVSPQITSDSRVLVHRNISKMVEELAPFLRQDSDPYPVLHNGRTIWVMDLYTISDAYPYSAQVADDEMDRLHRISGIPSGINYIRNSVKATIDSFDGTVTFYVVDQEDPIIRAWSKVYPKMFSDFGSMPEGIQEHLRYPQDLFTVQGEMYLAYHMEETEEFFQRADLWGFPKDPSTIIRLRSDELLWGDQITAQGRSYNTDLLPSYLLMRLPGEEGLSYVLAQAFNPATKNNMVGILMADSTFGRYGRLVEYRFPRGSLVQGPGQVGQRIEQDPDIAREFSLWRSQGSQVLLGDMHVVPIEESILYVQPVFLSAQEGGIPEFRRVVVAYGERVEWDATLAGALSAVFGAEEPTVRQYDVEELIEKAAGLLEDADEALKEGDLGEYQRLVEAAQGVLDEALGKLSENGVE